MRKRICAFLFFLILLVLSTSGLATIYTVTTGSDNGSNSSPTVNSLRWAILQANAGSGNTITINTGFTITIPSGAHLPVIRQPMTIQSASTSTNVVINGQGAAGLFYVYTGGADTVTIKNITFQNGKSQGGAGGNSTDGTDYASGGGLGAGGAIFAGPGIAVTLTDCIFSSNTAVGGAPGGFYGYFNSCGGGGGGMLLGAGGVGQNTSDNMGGGGGGGGIGAVGGLFGSSGSTGIAVGLTGGGSGGDGGWSGIFSGGSGGPSGGGGGGGGQGGDFLGTDYAGGGGGGGGIGGATGSTGNVAVGGDGGDAGFGGGGGGGGGKNGFPDGKGGAGGFGGGSGGGETPGSPVGGGELGGGAGQGGAAKGGSIFMGGGNITITSTNISSTFSGGSVTAGSGNTASGTDIYLYDGSDLSFTIGSGRTLQLDGTIAAQNNTSAVSKSGAGTLILKGDNTFSSNMSISDGLVQFTLVNSLGTGGTVNLTGGGGIQPGVNSLTFSKIVALGTGGGRIDTNAFTLIVSGDITGSTLLTKTGAGTLEMSGAKAWSGGLYINGGTVQISHDNQLGSGAIQLGQASAAGAIKVTGTTTTSKVVTVGPQGGFMDVNSGIIYTLTGKLAKPTGAPAPVAGNLTKQGLGTLEVDNTTSDYSGTILLTAGTLKVNSNDGLGASTTCSVNLSGTSTFDVNGKTQTIKDLESSTNTTISLGSSPGILTFGTSNDKTIAGKISGSGGLTKIDTGTVTLSKDNTAATAYSGITRINGGYIQISNGNQLGTGSVRLGESTAIGGLKVTATTTTAVPITVGAFHGIIDVSPSVTNTLTGLITGAGNLTKQGTGILEVSNTSSNHSGTILLTAGTLKLNIDNGLGASTTCSVNISGTATFDVNGKTQTIKDLESSTSTTISLGGSSGVLTFGTTDNSKIIAGKITGSGGLTKIDTGTVTLSKDNTAATAYSGITRINGGYLQISNGNQLGTGSVRLGESTAIGGLKVTATTTTAVPITVGALHGIIDVSPGMTNTLTGLISGAGNLTKNNTGILQFQNTSLVNPSTHSGTIIVSAGTISLGSTNGMSQQCLVDLQGTSIFNLNAYSQTIKDLTGVAGTQIQIGGGVLTFGTATPSTIFAGVASGTGSITKQNSGTVTFSGVNTYTGTTTVNGGILELKGSTVGSEKKGNITVANGATLRILTNSDIFNVANVATINGIFELNGTNQSVGDLTDSGSGTRSIVLGGNTLTFGKSTPTKTFSGVISGTGNIVKNGTGTAILSGLNTYTGMTTVTAGKLVLNGSPVPIEKKGNISISLGATLEMAQADIIASGSNALVNGTWNLVSYSQTVSDLTGSGTINLGVALTTLGVGGAGNCQYDGIFIGQGRLVKNNAGILTLTATVGNTFTGGITVQDGTLVGNSLNILGDILNEGAIIFTQAFDGTYAGIMSGLTGSLEKQGTGKLTLSGANTYSGGTWVTGGSLEGTTLSLQGNIVDNSTLIFNQAFNGTYSGQITGSGIVQKIGSGVVTFSNSNSNTLGATISGGTLKLITGASYSRNVVVQSGGTLDLNGGTVVAPGTISGDSSADSRVIVSSSFTPLFVISNVGIIENTGGLLTLNGGLVPTGFVEFKVNGTGNTILNTPMTFGASQSLRVSGISGIFTMNSNVTNNGLVRVDTDGLMNGTGTLINNKDIALYGGQIQRPITGSAGSTLTVFANSQTGNTITGVETITAQSGVFTIQDAVTGFTNFNIESGGTTTLGVDLLMPGGATFTQGGIFNMNGFTLEGNPSDIFILQSYLSATGEIKDVGTIQVDSGTFLMMTQPTGFDTLTLNGGSFIMDTDFTLPVGAVINNNNGSVFNMGMYDLYFASSGTNTLTIGGYCVTSGEISSAGPANHIIVVDGVGSNNESLNGHFVINNPVSGYASFTVQNKGQISLNSGGSLSSVPLTLISGIVNINEGGNFSGIMNGDGNSILNINGTYTTAGTITVGTLNVNDGGTLIFAAPMTVNQIVNMGTISHQSLSVQNITSNFVQAGNLNIQIDSQSAYSSFHVFGTTTLSGGVINAYLPNGASDINSGDELIIITSDGGIVLNELPSVNAPISLFFSFTPKVEGNEFKLVGTRNTYQLVNTNPVLEGVSEALDAIVDLDQTQPGILNQYPILGKINVQTTVAGVEKQLLALIPDEVNGGVIESTLTLHNLVLERVIGRLDMLRAGVDSFQSGYTAGDIIEGRSSYGPILFGSTARQSERGQMSGYKADHVGFGVLVDAPISSFYRVGLGLTYGLGSIRRNDYTKNLTQVQDVQGILYGSASYGPLFFDGLVSYGLNFYNGKRNIPSLAQTAVARYKGYQYGAKVEGGFSLPVARVEISPFASLEYVRITRGSYIEKEAIPSLNLSVTTRQVTSMQLALGGKIAEVSEPEDFIPELHAKVIYDLKPVDGKVTSQFVSGGPVFISDGPIAPRGGVNVGTSITAFLHEDVLINGGYDLTLKKGFIEHSASFKFRWVF